VTALTRAADVARLLSLPADTSEAGFLAVAKTYELDSRFERQLGNHVHGETLRQLAALAREGAALRRDDDAITVLSLLCAAAPEVIPVDALVETAREASLWVITITGAGALVARAAHPDALTAVRNAARALLAREGAEGPHCDALREAVSR